MVTNGYGVMIAGLRNFEVVGNTIVSDNGRGISIDTYSNSFVTSNGVIRGNYVSVGDARTASTRPAPPRTPGP